MNEQQTLSDIPVDQMPRGVSERQVKRNAEAFLETASGIPDEMLNREPMQPTQPTQPAPAQVAPTPVEKSKFNHGLNLGPKYLDALSHLNSLTETRAISVQLPMSLKTVEMTAITGVEEQALKTASVAPETFLKKLNELIYTHVVFVDGTKPTFSEFLDGIYPPDKAALIWGLLSASYVVLPELERECTSCGNSYLIKSTPQELIHEDTFNKIWDHDLSPAEYTIKQEAFDGYVSFEFGVPTEKDRIVITSLINPETVKDNVAKEGSIMTQLDMLTFFTRSITVGNPGEEIVLTSLTQDIYPFIRNLSPKIADGIRSVVDLSIFDEYMPNFYIETPCSHCGVTQKAEIDVELIFFRKTLAV